jgi:hypothetical protein
MSVTPLRDFWSKWITVVHIIPNDDSLQNDAVKAIKDSLENFGYDTRYANTPEKNSD